MLSHSHRVVSAHWRGWQSCATLGEWVTGICAAFRIAGRDRGAGNESVGILSPQADHYAGEARVPTLSCSMKIFQPPSTRPPIGGALPVSGPFLCGFRRPDES